MQRTRAPGRCCQRAELCGRRAASTADNTDGLGLVADITRNAGVPLQGARLLLVGAGGAAAGVLGPLLQAGVRHITIANRTVAKAEALVASHSALAALQKAELLALAPQAVEGDFDVIINATASSLAGDAVPVPASVLRPGSLAYDMMYGPAAQGFLDWAQAHGAVARDGLGMLVEQAAEAFAIWRGVRPPSAQVLEDCAAPRTDTSHARTARHALQHPGAQAIKALLRWLGLVLLALVGLQLLLCCALRPWRPSTPESTTFQRIGSLDAAGQQGQRALAPAVGCLRQDFRPPQTRRHRIGRRWLCEPRGRGLGRD